MNHRVYDCIQKHFVLSLTVVMTSVIFSIYAFAAILINLSPPTKYTDGSELAGNLIDHFSVCVSRGGGSCDYMYAIPADSTRITNYPEWAYQVRARTVLKTGVFSDWSNPITVGQPSPPAPSEPKIPEPPTLSIGEQNAGSL